MSNRLQFKRLAEPVRIGRMLLRNRMAMAPMGTDFADREGLVTEETKRYYEARARGGVGMVIVENACVDFPQGRQGKCRLSISGEHTLAGLTELAQVIKRHGARAAIQLHHAGRVARSEITGVQPVGPSPIAAPGGEMPRELSLAEIGGIVTRFAQAGALAKRAGFEGVEVHGAHHYLIAQFMSHASNRRQDEYGGSVRNRARLLLEVLDAVKRGAGSDYPVWCRINGTEYGLENGLTLEEALEVVKIVEDASDAISVSAFGYGRYALTVFPDIPGELLALAAAIKKVVNKPVLGVGKITPETGERAVEEGKIDIALIGRGLIADPDLPNKVVSGAVENIRPCISCFVCNDLRDTKDGRLRCSVNAAAGQEGQYVITSVGSVKRVVIVGGGPAGMEAARVAALRGHQVTLYEKASRLGGQLVAAAVPSYKGELEKLRSYFVTQMQKLGIQVELGKEVTPGLLQKLKPDAVILATGIIPMIPELLGLDRANVVLDKTILTGEVNAGQNVVIIGGGMVGCETAYFLQEQGKTVTVVEMMPQLAPNMRPNLRTWLLNRLSEKPIAVFTGARCQELTADGLVITNRDGKLETLKADTVVLAVGAKPNNTLFQAVQGTNLEVYQAGDCCQPRGIMEAVDEGMRAALSV